MKKIFTIITALFIIINIYPQVQKDNLVYNQLIKEDSKEYVVKYKPAVITKNDYSKKLIEYDKWGNVSKETYQDRENEKWVDKIVRTYLYDNDKIISLTTDGYGGKNRFLFEYSSTGQMIKKIKQKLDDKWVDNEIADYSFNENGMIDTILITIMGDKENIKNSMSVHSYDKNMNIASIENKIELNGEWVSKGLMEYSYNEKGHLISWLMKIKTSEEWEVFSKFNYTYSDNGNCFEIHHIKDRHGNLSNIKIRTCQTFDDSLRPIVSTMEEWKNESWTVVQKSEKKYDANGNFTEEYNKSFAGGLFGFVENDEENKSILTYDENNNLIKTESYKLKDNNWIIESIESNNYDKYENVIETIDEQFGDDVKITKTIFHRDSNGTDLGTEKFIKIKDKWVNQSKIINEFDTENNCISSKAFKWVNDKWIPKNEYLRLEYNKGGSRYVESADSLKIDYVLSLQLGKINYESKEVYLGQNQVSIDRSKFKLEFAVPKTGRVKIKVYPIFSEAIELFNEVKEAGNYILECKLPEEAVFPGCYYQLEFDNYISPSKSLVNYEVL